MSDSKKKAVKPIPPWQHLLDAKKQRQASQPFRSFTKSGPTPRFNFNKRSGSR